jgi:hypothetical protein
MFLMVPTQFGYDLSITPALLLDFDGKEFFKGSQISNILGHLPALRL